MKIILTYVNDLFFRSKLNYVEKQYGFTLLNIDNESDFFKKIEENSPQIIVFDLNWKSDKVIKIIQGLNKEKYTLTAFYAHVNHDLLLLAKNAGCHYVFTRREFIGNFDKLLANKFSKS
jgi:hypothetical protein